MKNIFGIGSAIASTIASNVLVLALAPPALAHPNPCRWGAFTPQAFVEEIRDDLAVIAVSIAPAPVRNLGIPSGGYLLVRQGLVIGSLQWADDVRTGRSTLSVYDLGPDPLFEVTKEEHVCYGRSMPGLCESIAIVSGQQPVASGIEPFRVELWPGDSQPHYFRYGQEQEFFVWRHNLVEAYIWLSATIDAASVGYEPVISTPEEGLYWALASDPLAARYLSALTIKSVAGHLKVFGVVPSNAVFDAIVAAAINNGYGSFEPLMVIDTGLPDRGRNNYPTLGRCEP